MEKLTKEQIEDIVDDLRSFDFLPIGREGRKPYEQICKGAEQMRDELLAYKHLENKIGCPLEVRCKLYDGASIYDENGEKMIVRDLGEHDFLAYQTKECSANLTYIKGYKKTWWLKEDRSE